MRRITRKIEADREAGARRGLLEELYSDFYSNRRKVYQINFMRGIFFGVGSVVGGTLVVTSVLAVLGILTDVPGWFGEFIQFVVDSVRQSNTQ
ncbi:hypothetical protein GW930_01510 [Candidatus Saccharibacteria bacterium]|nr:hypothetical protein [Candidatus Saccharibacteria bacterium]